MPTLESALDAKAPREITLPGADQHRELLRRAILQAWVTGYQLAADELERENRARLGRFMGSDPPDTPKPNPGPPPSAAMDWLRKRDVLLGKWDRDLDQAVTQVLVHALETGASKAKVMKALGAIFEDFGKHRLENIARTETSAALTQGRLARFREPGSNVVAVQFVAIMDARTTAICRSRDGLIMKLDDDRLPANTPPLHFMCRSTLVAITDWVWTDLENGDERALKRWFGWLKGDSAPHTLADALGGWAEVPAPLKGFGEVGARPKPAPKLSTTPAKPKRERKPKPSRPEALRKWIDKRKAKGIDDPDDVREVGRRVLAEVRKGLPRDIADREKALRAAHREHVEATEKTLKAVQNARRGIRISPLEAQTLASKYEETMIAYKSSVAKIAQPRRKGVLDVLSGIQALGGEPWEWADRTPRAVKDSIARVSEYVPTAWLQASRAGKPVRGKMVPVGGSYGKASVGPDILKLSGTGEALDEVALHELGHRLELTNPFLQQMAQAYFEQRTAGERVRSLADVYPGRGYKLRDLVKTDRWSEAYFGRIYPGSKDTEIISMGLESLFFSTNFVWEDDHGVLEFILGLLAL